MNPNPKSWPFLFDLADLQPKTQSYLKRLGKKLYEGQPLEDLAFSRSEYRNLRKRGLAHLLLIGAMAKDGQLDHESTQRYSPPFDSAKALLTLDVPLLINLEPGVDWQALLLTASARAFESGIHDWYANPDEAYTRYAGYEAERAVEIVTLRACATLHSDVEDSLDFMPFSISKAIFSFGTTQSDMAKAITWFKEWEASERQKDKQAMIFGWKHELIKAMSNRYAFLWHLQGHSVEAIVTHLRSVLPAVLELCFPSVDAGISKAVTDVRVAHFLSAFPDHWGMEGFQVEHLLGVPHGTFEGESDYALHSLAEAVVHREGSDYDLQGPIIKRFHAIDQSICSAVHVDRMGTRQMAWTELVIDWSPAAEKLNEMLQKGVWHPALHGLNTIDLLDGEASAAAALGTYLADGGNGNGKRAANLIERYPQVLDAALPTLKKRTEIQRLAAIIKLKAAQIQQLPPRFHDVVLGVDLGL